MADPFSIIRVLKIQSKKRPDLFSNDFENEPDDILVRRFFSNYRQDDQSRHGMRLTQEGFEVMSKFFQHYMISFPKDYLIKSRHLIFLDRACTMPWYLAPTRLALFEPELAMQLKLVSDLDVLIDTLGADFLGA